MNAIQIGIMTCCSLFFVWLSFVLRPIEQQWADRVFLPSFSAMWPYEDRIERWLQHSGVQMSARQWVGFLALFSIGLPLVGLFYPSSESWTLMASIYLTVSLLLYPFQKEKRIRAQMQNDLRRALRMIAKLYQRDVHTADILPIVQEVMEDGPLKTKLQEAILRTKTTDTLEDALVWLADTTALPALQHLAARLAQATRYADIPIGEQLLQMAEKEREQVLFTQERLAEQKRISALLQAALFIALPLLFLVASFAFSYTFKEFMAF